MLATCWLVPSLPPPQASSGIALAPASHCSASALQHRGVDGLEVVGQAQVVVVLRVVGLHGRLPGK
jgi:hypothetical protein